MNQHLLHHCCRHCIALFVLLLAFPSLYAQPRKARVLFIGNSYTYGNDLPKLIADVAASNGDTLEYDMSAPGGYTFYHHYLSTPVTKAKIEAGGWDYVVLQEQSQYPARPDVFFNEWVYPYAKYLVQHVKQYNPCAEVIFYMTWGRKKGDASLCYVPINWKYFCTYHWMDSVLRARYILMADGNKASLSPVGAVWRYIRSAYPAIALYEADESHPSPAGSYAGACSFYTAIFKRSPTTIRYDFSLPAATAAQIRTAAHQVVYDSLHFWRIGQHETMAGFRYSTQEQRRVRFTNESANATRYSWDFGDGHRSTDPHPIHTYSSTRTYTVRLIASGVSCQDTAYAFLNVSGGPNGTDFIIEPNPVTTHLHIRSALFGSQAYRLQLLPITGQPVYDRPASGAFTQTISVVGLPKGIYVVNICTTRSNYRKKIVVQ